MDYRFKNGHRQNFADVFFVFGNCPRMCSKYRNEGTAEVPGHLLEDLEDAFDGCRTDSIKVGDKELSKETVYGKGIRYYRIRMSINITEFQINVM